MKYSFSTVYMTFLSSTVLLFILILFLKNIKLLARSGYQLLVVLFGLTFLRFVLPIELPFTVTILLPRSISYILSQIQHPFFSLGKWEISMWTILEAIWIVGILVSAFKYFHRRSRSRYAVLVNSLDCTDEVQSSDVLEKICAGKKRRNNFHVQRSSAITVPMVTGIFRPTISLPEDLELSNKDSFFVLAHEAFHHFYHDVLTKAVVRALNIIYWWNPFSKRLDRATGNLLEYRIDDKVTESKPGSTLDYLRCMEKLAEFAASKCAETGCDDDSPLFTDDETELTRRFKVLLMQKKNEKLGLKIALLTLMILLFVGSYMVTFEAHYISPENARGTIELSAENTYAVEKEDGTYDIYFNNSFTENIDSLKYYSRIPTYTEEEFKNELHKDL